MKPVTIKFLFLAAILFAGLHSYAQESSTKIKVTSDGPDPLFVVKYKNKSAIIERDGDQPLKDIDPNWIKQIDILKDQKAEEQFGDKGVNGVVIIELKKSAYKTLPKDMKELLKKGNR